jgi:hypothetical protein
VRFRTALLGVAIAVSSAAPAFAIKEWYDYYLDARDRLIPAKKWDEALAALKEAERLKPNSAIHEQLYGLEFEDYFPYFYSGLCYLQGKQDYETAQRMFLIEEAQGAIKKSETKYQELKKRRAEAQDLENERFAARLRDEEDRLLREATDLYKARRFDEALAKLALAQAGANGIDLARQQQLRELTDKIKADKTSVQATEARTRRLEDAFQEGRRLLADNRPTEAIVAFDEVLTLDPKNVRAADAKKEAEARILASTTRQGREQSLKQGKALVDSGRYEEALRPLSDAAAEPQSHEAQRLLEEARKVVEGIREARDKRVKIERLLGEGEAALTKRAYPEASVLFDSVLQLDPTNAKARERMGEANRLTGNTLRETWFPNQKPILSFFEPRALVQDTPTVTFIGVATDDRTVAFVDFYLNGKLLKHVLPPASDSESHRSVNFEQPFTLAPGENDFLVTAQDDMGLASERRFKIERRLRLVENPVFLPSAFAAALGLVGCGLLVQHARRRRALRNRFNPYIAGAPVLDDDLFFGREKLTSRILNVLHHNSLMITGERRIGKTTFLYHLGKALTKDDGTEYRFFPVFTDLQGVPESSFFQAVMGDIVDGLALSPTTLSALRLSAETKAYDGRDFGHDVQRVIEELKTRTPKKVKLALLIDEVDVLNSYSERINQRLRSIFMKTFAEHLVAVMSGVGIKRVWKSEGSPWYNFFDEIELTALSRDEAEDLIRNPVTGFFRYEPDACEAILRYSELKPYVIQKFCVHAVNRILEQGRVTVTLSDVEAVRPFAETEHPDTVPERIARAR